jgi:5-methylcytosine-specific restriction endonuclease McrA
MVVLKESTLAPQLNCVTYDEPGLGSALVLNLTYEPLGIVASKRAMLLSLAYKVEVLHTTGRYFRSASFEIPEPSVVKLRYRIKTPYFSSIALTRKAVFIRDNHRCQYCGGPAESIDHVLPRSKGGSNSWDNVVAACKKCNFKKKDRLMHEVGYSLAKPPVIPRNRWMLMGELCHRQDWEPYLKHLLSLNP